MDIIVEFALQSTGEILGTITKTGIDKALIPKWHINQTHSSYITRHFTSHPNISYWQVISVIASFPKTNDHGDENLTITVRLDAVRETVMSYGAFAMGQSTPKKTHNLGIFQLVAVDFGHYSSLATASKIELSNQEFLSNILDSELHKRRPCVILSKDSSTVQVLPLTTKEQKGLTSLNTRSFEGLAHMYSVSTSYALPGMIQSVSVFRIFPLRSRGGKMLPHKQVKRVVPEDRDKIRNLLAETYHPDLVAKCKDYDEITNKNKELEALLLKVSGFFGLDQDPEGALEALENEIS